VHGRTIPMRPTNKRSVQNQMIFPKMEYQSIFGAEIVKASDLNKQYVSAMIRPGSKIMQVRIQPFTSKILSIDEVKLEHRKVAHSNCVFLLEAVFNRLKRLTVGNYLLRHTDGQGFYELLESTCDSKIASYDLHKSYKNNPTTRSKKIEWLKLDIAIESFGKKEANKL